MKPSVSFAACKEEGSIPQLDNLLDYPSDPLSTDSSRALYTHLKPFLKNPIMEMTSEIMGFLSGNEFRILIREIVETICSDPAELLRCAQRSQSHPLGFSKLLILSTKWCQIRLNFWAEFAPNRKLEDIHDHRFDFASTILTGALIAELYEIADIGETMVHFIDRLPAKHGEPYVLEEIGPVCARKVGVHRLARGSAYVTRSESLHRIIPIEDSPVVTAFVKFAPVRADANVLITPVAAAERQLQARHFYTADTVRSTLQQVLSLLSN